MANGGVYDTTRYGRNSGVKYYDEIRSYTVVTFDVDDRIRSLTTVVMLVLGDE